MMLLRIILCTVACVLMVPGSTQTCDDVDSNICQGIFNLDPNMCTNNCYSDVLCKRFCGKCPLKCYACHEVDRPDLCNTTTECPSSDHICITTESFTDDFQEVYKLGCASNTVCQAHFGPMFGRRSHQPSKRTGQFKGSCCTTDLCNAKLQTTLAPTTLPTTTAPTKAPSTYPTTKAQFIVPSTPPTTNFPTMAPSSYPTSTVPTKAPSTYPTTVSPSKATSALPITDSPSAMSTMSIPSAPLENVQRHVPASSLSSRQLGVCSDIDSSICNNLEKSFPDMCKIDCIANGVCPRKCGKCMECYQCSHVPRTEMCNQTTVCTIGQQCFSVETISATFEQGFRMGCMDEKLCTTFGHAAPAIFGKRQGFELSLHGGCCKGELCNEHKLLPSTTIPTTTETTTTKSCPSHYRTCPAGWLHHGHSCFALASSRMTWTEAKAKCASYCAELADFSSTADLQSFVRDFASHYHYSTIDFSSVWVDGVFNKHGKWEWSSNGHEADGSFQHNIHYSGNYCGKVSLSHTSSHYSVLNPAVCTSHNVALCEIEHV